MYLIGSVLNGAIAAGRQTLHLAHYERPTDLSHLRTSRTRRLSRVSLVLALLALLLRVVLPDPASASQTAETVLALGDIPICHAAPEPSSDDGGRSHSSGHGTHDCTLCPACHLANAAIAVMPSTPSVGIAHPLGKADPVRVHPATGPPQHGRYAAGPRGPPTLPV